jgi:hypothetical protein
VLEVRIWCQHKMIQSLHFPLLHSAVHF